MDVNVVAVSGHLTKDPEVRALPSGIKVLTFTLAVNGRAKGRNGEWEDRVEYVRCDFFGRRAEAAARWMHKGDKVFAKGRLHYDQWVAKDGTRRHELNVLVDNVDIPYAHQPEDQPVVATPATQGAEGGETEATPPGVELYDHDVPF